MDSMFHHISIGQKLFYAFSLLTCIAFAIGYLSSRNIERNNEMFDEIISGTTPRIQALLEMKNISNEIGHNVMLVQTVDIDKIESEKISTSDSKSLILANLERLLHWSNQYSRSSKETGDDVQEAFLRSVTESKSAIVNATLDYVDAKELGVDGFILLSHEEKLNTHIDSLKKLIDSALVTETEGLRIQKELAEEGMKNARLTIIIMSGLSVCLAVVAWALLSRLIVRRLRELRNATHAVAEGNLDYTITSVGGDEIGDLADAFIDMTGKLRESHTVLTVRNSELEKAEHELKKRLDETETINKHMVDRELKMIELKKEVASLRQLIETRVLR